MERTQTNTIIDIFFESDHVFYALESENEYRSIEIDHIALAEAIDIDVTYNDEYDEYYLGGILQDFHEFTEQELLRYVNALPEPCPIKETRSSVMIEAWNMLKSGVFTTFSASLKAAWLKIKLSKRLLSGIAYFSYRKIDGSTRKAIGTLREGNFSYKYKSREKNNSTSVISYWDVQKKAFRSCRIENIISII